MRGTVVISLDLELSWGSFDKEYGPPLLERATWTHDVGVPRLLHHLCENGLSASWAIVGAMMRRSLPDISCIPPVEFPHFPRGWFDYVPKDGSESTHPEWFGGSLVELIRKAEPRQEIGFHSFSHVLFGWPGMTRERAVAEYELCRQIAYEYQIPTTCFVFPRNSVRYVRELGEAGFTCFRDVDRTRLSVTSSRLRSLAAVLADFCAWTPLTVQPSLLDGVVAIPGSLMVRYAAGWRKCIPDACRSRRLRRGMEAARQNGQVFHVWFHPENLHAGWPRVENVVARFLRELGAAVRAGELRCTTMGQLAAEFLAAQSVHRGSTALSRC